MDTLSVDLKNHIYYDFLQLDILNQELNNLLNSELCMQLNYTELSLLLRKILSHQKFVIYLKKNNEIFNNIYTTHIMNNNKFFVNLEIIDSFALCWLMYLYH